MSADTGLVLYIWGYVAGRGGSFVVIVLRCIFGRVDFGVWELLFLMFGNIVEG